MLRAVMLKCTRGEVGDVKCFLLKISRHFVYLSQSIFYWRSKAFKPFADIV